ncbi:hypothetical protein ACIQZO_19430 [Streptomyces sp. NPDC097617]|uniref:hypothetical protein n=1 Tax=Streptomyces sp. NPDC097617 TaxID=3366091 RepID=UPI0037FCC706
MPLHAKEFFDSLELPFPFGTVVGDVYYATPTGSQIRLRIEFARTIMDRQYDGLRLTLVHTERGNLDTVHLRFSEHGTFMRRDAERGPGAGQGVIRDWHKDGPPPWAGAELTGLRTGIVDFVQVTWPALITPAGFAEREPWAERWHEELWATDTTMLTRLHEATDTVLALVDGGTYDDMPITDSLCNARYYVRDMLGLRLDQAMLAEAEAVVQLTGRPLGPETAAALTRIAGLPMDQQHRIAMAALRRHAATPTAPTTSTPPARSVPGPAQTPVRSR